MCGRIGQEWVARIMQRNIMHVMVTINMHQTIQDMLKAIHVVHVQVIIYGSVHTKKYQLHVKDITFFNNSFSLMIFYVIHQVPEAEVETIQEVAVEKDQVCTHSF